MDTVPEVKPAFWQSFNSAASVYAVGEVFNGDIAYVSPFQGSALDGVLSYPMYYALRDVFGSGHSFTQLQSVTEGMSAAFKDTGLLGSFLDNHDNERYLNIDGADQVNYKNALLYMLFSPGIPIVYYGSEQGFSGGADPA